MSLSKIKARLGSVSPQKIDLMPLAVQKILTEDMPKLIRIAEEARIYLQSPSLNSEILEDALLELVVEP